MSNAHDTAATITPWVSIFDVEEYGEGEIIITRRSEFSIWHADGSSSWADQTPATFVISAPLYDDRDAIRGTTYRPLPAAQQYGLKCAAWVQDQKWMAELDEDFARLTSEDEPF